MGKYNMMNICTGMAGAGFGWRRTGNKLFAGGSYTVEAAFVFPVVLGICFAILYSIFFYHDRAMLQTNLEGALLLEAEAESLDEIEKKEYLQQRLWLFACEEYEIHRGLLYLNGSVTARASLHIPLFMAFLEENQKISLSENYPLIHPESYQRYRRSKKEESDGETDAG